MKYVPCRILRKELKCVTEEKLNVAEVSSILDLDLKSIYT